MHAKRAAFATLSMPGCPSDCRCRRWVAPRTVLMAQASSVKATALLIDPPTFVIEGMLQGAACVDARAHTLQDQRTAL